MNASIAFKNSKLQSQKNYFYELVPIHIDSMHFMRVNEDGKCTETIKDPDSEVFKEAWKLRVEGKIDQKTEAIIHVDA